MSWTDGPEALLLHLLLIYSPTISSQIVATASPMNVFNSAPLDDDVVFWGRRASRLILNTILHFFRGCFGLEPLRKDSWLLVRAHTPPTPPPTRRSLVPHNTPLADSFVRSQDKSNELRLHFSATLQHAGHRQADPYPGEQTGQGHHPLPLQVDVLTPRSRIRACRSSMKPLPPIALCESSFLLREAEFEQRQSQPSRTLSKTD